MYSDAAASLAGPPQAPTSPISCLASRVVASDEWFDRQSVTQAFLFCDLIQYPSSSFNTLRSAQHTFVATLHGHGSAVKLFVLQVNLVRHPARYAKVVLELLRSRVSVVLDRGLQSSDTGLVVLLCGKLPPPLVLGGHLVRLAQVPRLPRHEITNRAAQVASPMDPLRVQRDVAHHSRTPFGLAHLVTLKIDSLERLTKNLVGGRVGRVNVVPQVLALP
mmetsp:Transcript_13574/g.43344  ORF Transcript_13574/g.43344 Transcript_13574/m.43344 type:complete len:219 (-) Transcript_13574:1069-1725(-)